MSFISEDTIRHSRLTRSSASIPLLGIGGTFSGRTKGVISIQLQSIHDPAAQCIIQAYVPRLTTKLPSCNTNCRSWPHTQGLPLADPEFFKPGPIHIIIGSDNYSSVISFLPGLKCGNPVSPIAQLTIFGWILCDPVSTYIPHTVQAHHCSIDHDLHELLARFWSQEESPSSTGSQLSAEEEACEQHYQSTHSRDVTGRYVVRLPLKSAPTALGDSETKARACLNRLYLQFSTKPILKQLYSDFITEYEKLGHMVRMDNDENSTSTLHYLPYHGVLREGSSTTKLRVIFNGSNCTSSGKSLNDIFYLGAKLQADMLEILL